MYNYLKYSAKYIEKTIGINDMEIDWEENLFNSIFKYRQSEKKSPLEDYCTEIFVYILRQLIKNKDNDSYKILQLFGLKELAEKDLSDIKIETRQKHLVNNKKCFPDILLILCNKNIVVEVKINSDIRKYKIKRKNIDQIELYKNITDIKIDDVFLLSKYLSSNNSLNNSNKVLWSEIYSILINNNNEIIKNFVLFLEENGMKASIVKPGAENALDSIVSIMQLIENSSLKDKYTLKPEVLREYCGVYLKDKDKDLAWVGQLNEQKQKEYLVFEPLSGKILKNAKKVYKEKNEEMELDSSECYIFSKIKIKDITCYDDEKKQKEKFQKWIDEEINIIL
jgi:hypothetical protein